MEVNQIGAALETLSKAITSTDVSNGALVREDLQSGLVIAGPAETPLRNKLNRVPGNGTAHSFYVMKPNADVSQGVFYGTTPGNGVFPKGGLPVDNTEAYKLVAVPYANLGDVAQVTFQDQAQGRSFTDLMAQRTKVKALNTALMEEYFILNGDSAVTQPGGGFIFDGLLKQISNGGVSRNSPDQKITLGLIRQLSEDLWEKGSSADTLLLDGLCRGILQAQVLQIYAIRGGGSALTDASGGVSINAWDFGYGPVEWITDRYLVPNSYTNNRSALLLNTQAQDGMNDGNVIQMVDVDPLHSVDLAIVATAWRKVIYETTTLMVSVPQFQGIIPNLNPTAAGQTALAG